VAHVPQSRENKKEGPMKLIKTYLLIPMLFLPLSAETPATPGPATLVHAVPGKLIDMNHGWRFDATDSEKYASAEFDDSKWKVLSLEREWRFYGVEYDGVAWYRKSFTFAPELAGKNLGLALPALTAAYQLFLNGQLIGTVGKIGATGKVEHVREDVQYYELSSSLLAPAPKQNVLALRIASLGGIGGGFAGLDFFLGPNDLIYERHFVTFVVFALMAGAFFVIGLYYLILYFARRDADAALWFALLAICQGAFTLGMKAIVYKFIDNYIVNMIFMHATVILFPTLLLHFGHSFFSVKKDWFLRTIDIACGFGALLFAVHFLVPGMEGFYVIYQLPAHVIFILVAMIRFIWLNWKGYRNGVAASRVVASGGLLFFLCVAAEGLSYLDFLPIIKMTDIGFLVLIFSMAMALAIQLSKVWHEKEEAQKQAFESQALLTRAYARFVPLEFLQQLNKQSILDVSLGDQVQRDMGVMFSDIRDFTTLAESMQADDLFRFVNSYLFRLAPIFTAHQGYIDKYIGDAIMVLFHGNMDAAVKGCIAVLHDIEQYNLDRAKAGYSAISIGIGLNFGRLTLGTVGNPERMDGTVLSDEVNLASRIEGLTKLYKVDMIVTDKVVAQLSNPADFDLRQIDRVRVKGKQLPTTIYECFNADAPAVAEKKRAMQGRWQDALHEYYAQKFEQAGKVFSEIDTSIGGDKISRLYIKRCHELAVAGLTADWDGTHSLKSK
jgi:adenylate cyclase